MIIYAMLTCSLPDRNKCKKSKLGIRTNKFFGEPKNHLNSSLPQPLQNTKFQTTFSKEKKLF